MFRWLSLFAFLGTAISCGSDSPTEVDTGTPPTQVADADYTTTGSGLRYFDLVVGNGATPSTGQTVSVHYTGWLTNNVKFDSSVDRNQPFTFVLGTGRVIAGWDEGVATMKVGGKRQLVIPAPLAYGTTGSGAIPPNATLIFEVELLQIL
jgi:peptidylprolyl isomerase